MPVVIQPPVITTVNYPPATQPFTNRAASDITDFVVHHSAGPTNQTVLQIDAFERSRGDIFMPYTWLIDSGGTIYAGRPPLAVSAATFGRNTMSVAVCLIGNFESTDAGFTGDPPAVQVAALTDLCTWAHRTYPAIAQTYAHGDVATLFYGGDGNYATACCGDRLRALLPSIKANVAAALQHGGA